jgi:hypothetical protein
MASQAYRDAMGEPLSLKKFAASNHEKDMQLRAILIDPARQNISELRISRSPDKRCVINALSRLIGCATMKFA